MTTRITKTWFDGEKLVTQEIAESEVYKQEPVAEVKLKTTGGNVGIATVIHEIYSHYREPLRVGDKLYTTPPAAQRQWVDLTDDDLIACSDSQKATVLYFMKKLKEKNT